jgi:hypothetical protein
MRTNLETSKYFQGSKTIDEYVNEFCEMINYTRYFEGAHIILKFCQGLNTKIQDHVACMTHGQPSDNVPKKWYDAAILCDEDRITNKAFTSSSRGSNYSEVSLNSGTTFQRLLVKLANSVPPISCYAPSITNILNPQRPKDMTSVICFRCGQSRHLQPDCPKHFDVRYMDLDKRQAFAQDEFSALDASEAEEKALDVVVEDMRQDFGLDNE